MIIDKDGINTVFLTSLVWFISGFDLILLTLASVEVQKLYFPNTDQTFSLLAVYGTLSLSLLGRVFGGLYFSRLADIHGRKPIVILCLMVISLIMILSAYMPNVYQSVSPLPSTIIPLMFILSRIVIGFFIGGIWPTAAILGLEIISSKNKLIYEDTDNRKIPFDLRWHKYLKNIDMFEEQTKKLTGKSALMQLGFFTGYFIAATLYYTHIDKIVYEPIRGAFVYIAGCSPMPTHIPCHIMQLILPDYNNIGPFGTMSLGAGIFGLTVFIFYRFFISESIYWKNWKKMYKEQGEILKEQKDLLKEKEMKDDKEKSRIRKKIELIEKESLEPGIKKLLDNTNNEKYRERVIGFWLVLSGLMYMYYSTVVVIPEILSRDDVSIESNNLFNQIPLVHQIVNSLLTSLNLIDKPHNIVTLIILATALIAHIIVGAILYNKWNKETIIKNRLIFPFFEIFKKLGKESNNIVLRILGSYIDEKPENNNKYDLKKHDLDIVTLKIIGFLIIIMGIINSIVFYTLLKDDHKGFGLVIIISTALATLIANSGWALAPSMLASRFPTHFRVSGSSLAYNGGLIISFASPFIIMEFYLSIKSEYMVFIAMILGAISMSIGAKRLMNQKNNYL